MKKRWVIVSVAGVALAAGLVFTLRGSDGKAKKPEANTPFRVGKVQAEDENQVHHLRHGQGE